MTGAPQKKKKKLVTWHSYALAVHDFEHSSEVFTNKLMSCISEFDYEELKMFVCLQEQG